MTPMTSAGTIAELLERAWRAWPDRVAIVSQPDDDLSLTYAELARRVAGCVARLREAGVSEGARVATMMSNRIAYPITWLACAEIGAIMVPVNSGARSLDAAYLIDNSGASHAVVDRAGGAVLGELRAERPGLVLLDVDGDDPAAAEAEYPPAPTRVFAETTVNIQYTSGTTGRPKGCVLSNEYWLTIGAKNVLDTPGFTADDVLLTAQPFSYMDPQWNLIAAIGAGARLVLLDGFHPSTFWESVRAYSATFFYCLGAMPMLMLKTPPDPRDRDHSVRLVSCSGIPIGAHRALEERFGVPWLETYGMTEIGNGAAMPVDQQAGLVASGAAGRASRCREIRVVDADDRPCPRGELGEVVVRGVGLMDRYHAEPEATAAAFRGGWFHTGDLGYLDEEGFLFLKGRTKEMVRRSGENVSVQEVEDAIGRHPAVRLAACVGVPDELRGEEVMAFVVLDDTVASPPSEETLAEHTGSLIARFKVPRYWRYVPELPITPSGKIAKSQLTAQVADLPAGCWDRAESRRR